ncbi:MAG: anaerobic sulfatase maturase [Lacunisphaera sp.]|nr:anaerobic sulfatase maturase [Lacunisphaera sp.]
MSNHSRPFRPPLHVLAKPIGPLCNLDCDYCFYLKKQPLFPAGHNFRMSDETLEIFIRRYIESHDGPEVAFAWQGGEPTLCGAPFFAKAVALQQRYANGRRISNALQTNGTLLDDEWGAFLHEHRFLVGLSVDGPRHLHDRHRQDKHRQPTFDRVMRGLAVLQKHHVEVNALTVVSSTNVSHPIDVYRFLRDAGFRHLQFIPLVERATVTGDDDSAAPARHAAVTAETVPAAAYGSFLNRIFDRWVHNDVGKIFVREFDTALAAWLDQPSSLCVHATECGRSLALEHDGSAYACDHYVYPSDRLGHLRDTPLDALVSSPAQVTFGRAKSTTLPRQCRACPVRFACNGGCPKHRFLATAAGEPGLNYLCAGYRAFFAHIDTDMGRMATLPQAHRPAADIMRH